MLLSTGAMYGLNAAGSVGLMDGLTPTAAWSMSRDLFTTWVGSARYTTATGIDSLKDQSGNARNLGNGSAGVQPAVTTAGPNSRTCADFDGTTDFIVGAALSNFITNSAGYMIASFMADTITLNDANIYNNHLIIGDQGAFAGIFVKNTAGSPETISSYNFDGTVDVASNVTVVAATPYVVEWRHESGNLYIRLNNGAWSGATASGNTSTMTGVMAMGSRNGLAALFDGKIFEAATFSTIPSTGTQDLLAAGFKSWIGA